MNIVTTLLNNLNYGAIIILMAIESSAIPFPSEVVVAPAGYHAAAGELNIFLVILFATLGADIGATINYAVAYFLGRPIIYKFVNSRAGKLCMLSQEKVERSEKYFYDHGVTATLTGRLLPVIRQLISIPAGLAKMQYWKFILYTTVGAGCWNSILATLGWYLHSIVPETELADKVSEYSHQIQVVFVIIIVLVIAYFVTKKVILRKRLKEE